MNQHEFWQIIDSVHSDSGGDMDRKCELLKSQLSKLPKQDIRDFIGHFDSADASAYTWSLWGAAYVMCGGCSDDSFSDFRSTLISHGSDIYKRALADPESLAELEFKSQDDISYEGFQYVHLEVEEEVFGEIQPKSNNFPSDPSGSEWDEDDLEKLYPKLSAKYSQNNIEVRPPSTKPWWKFW